MSKPPEPCEGDLFLLFASRWSPLSTESSDFILLFPDKLLQVEKRACPAR